MVISFLFLKIDAIRFFKSSYLDILRFIYYVFSLGIIGEWVNQGEAFLISDDEPAQFNEDSAALLNQKIDDHKQFFENYERTMEQVRFDLINSV